jgi:MFS superfamily sulfate permease-like transporter
MVDVKILYNIWKVRRLEEITLCVSFLGTLLLGIQYGVPIATGLGIVILLYRHARTRHTVDSRHRNVLYLSINGGWTYPGVEYIWKRIRTELKTQSEIESTL